MAMSFLPRYILFFLEWTLVVSIGRFQPATLSRFRRHNRNGQHRRFVRGAPLMGEMIVKFRVELVWTDDDAGAASSIFLTSDGRVILQGRAVSPQDRQALALPAQGDMISVDRNLIRAIKDML
jgi:hypothetical protein